MMLYMYICLYVYTLCYMLRDVHVTQAQSANDLLIFHSTCTRHGYVHHLSITLRAYCQLHARCCVSMWYFSECE